MLWLCVVIVILPVIRTNDMLDEKNKCEIEGKKGTCLRLQDCPPLMDEINKAGLHNIPRALRNKIERHSCGFVRFELLVCCIRTDRHINVNEIDPKFGVINNHRNMRLLPSDCGSMERNRIIGGERTELFEMPWMVLLAYNITKGPVFQCTGTLITERYVLTAAHCVDNRTKLSRVILGEYDTRSNPDCVGDQCAPEKLEVSIKDIKLHPHYKPKTLSANDIALLKLAEKVNFFSDSIKPICLPLTPRLQSENLTGVYGLVAGWGSIKDPGPQSPVLLAVKIRIISKEECQKSYKNRKIENSQLCIAAGKKGTCYGDSGGPLMYQGETDSGTRYVQRGIMSFGSKPCGFELPGIYIRVSNYIEWILDNID